MISKWLVFIAIGFSFCTAQTKINGVSFVASNTPISDAAIQPVLNLYANWVALMPFGFMKSESATGVNYNSKQQWWGETKIGITKTALAFHSKNCKVMLKPQIWIPNGGFTGLIEMKSEQDWLLFEKSYEQFILDYAQLAADNNVELFCIGTELNKFVTKRAAFWKLLIAKIKNIYKGKITYAENWDTFENVPFISSLDYIGIDAYFPLSKLQSPDIKALSSAWKPIKSAIKKLSSTYNRPILFTEYGYQSKDFAADQPWNHKTTENINLNIQCNALQALYNQFTDEKWFAGGFLWKWYDNHATAGGNFNTDYTIQNKPAESVVKNRFKK